MFSFSSTFQTKNPVSLLLCPAHIFLFEKMKEKFLMYGIFSKHLSINKQMVQYYDRHFMKQFIRGKLIQFGYKIGQYFALIQVTASISTQMKGKKPQSHQSQDSEHQLSQTRLQK